MTATQRKTVFIVVGRGFIAKSILRSGVLEELKKRGHRVVIFFFDVYRKGLPESLRREFEDSHVTLEAVPAHAPQRFYRRFKILTAPLVYNVNNRKFRYLSTGKSKFSMYLEISLFSVMSRLPFLKSLARFIERTVFDHHFYRGYFETYKPDVVFSTSIISSIDIEFLKTARSLGVKTVGMPRGWDNVNARFYPVLPDLLIVQNEDMKRDAVSLQGIPATRVVVSGFPQFDWYRKPKIIVLRDEFFRSRGLDPSKKLILWGSTGRWTQKGTSMCDMLVKAVNTPGILSAPAQLLIRAHFSDAKSNRFDYLTNNQSVIIDDNLTRSDFFWDGADPSTEELIKLANTLYHADLVIIQSSTLSLDALCFNKPVINTAFQGLYDKDGNDITPILYTEDCYRPLVEFGAVDLVHDETELVESINRFFEHPERAAAERKKALRQLAFEVDGQASTRVADAVERVMS